MTSKVPYERLAIDLAGPPQRFHLVGIGGAGMSAIARVLTALGHEVSGSDRAESETLAALRDEGIAARSGSAVERVLNVDVVGVSTAIPPDDLEVVAALAARIPVVHRYDLLAAIGATRRTLSVSGTHGKTTTSAITALALDSAGWNPSFIIGGTVAPFGAAARWTDGEWLVLEADESDSTFLAPPRAGAIVTNVEPDHLDHHGSFDALVAAFERFTSETDGPAVVCVDDLGAAPLAGLAGNGVSYGTSELADHVIGDIVASASGMTWTVTSRGVRHSLSIALPGRHLVLNATAAFALGLELGADAAGLITGIGRYRGVGRRFESRGAVDGITFIDDYAHMPTEVRAVLDAASAGRRSSTPDGWQRVVAVFQPHRFSRTLAVWPEYADAFDGADVVVITDVYAAGEAPVEGVTGELIADAVRSARPAVDVRWMPTRADLVAGLGDLLGPGDLCLTMGAGDLTTLPDELIATIGATRG